MKTTVGSIRKGPLALAAALLICVPTLVLMLVGNKTELSDEERKHKLRDISGGTPRVDNAGEYTGSLWKTPQTVGKLLLGQTPFARCDVHSVLVGENKIINDWIFMEERDAVNVAVMTVDGNFLTFSQTKYAIPGETLAPVGGFINNGEAPFDAARREVWEELGVGSARTKEVLSKGGSLEHSKESKENPFGTSTTPVAHDEFGLAIGTVADDEASSWVFLGKYRTMANRGGGFIYTYLLKDAIPLVEGGGTSEYLGRGDAESQKLVHLTREEATEAVMQGRFQEVKWAATVALGLLHLERNDK